MKRILFSVVLLAFIAGAQAQNYDAIKNIMAIGQFKKAKEDFDKANTNAKFAAKPEAFLLKTAVYAGLSMDNTMKGTPEAEQLTRDAEAAFSKYREMQPDLALLKDPIYQNAPINLYSSLFTLGYKDYEKKNWAQGFETFKKVVDISDLLIAQKLISVTVDTNSLLLAGIMAESSNNIDAAYTYYARLADLKVNDRDYESIYRFLVNQSFRKKDMAAFEKYRALGKQLYPKSEFFDYDKVDFAVGLEETFANKLKAVEEVLANDANNYKATFLLAGLIYDTLNSQEDNAVLPANYDELEPKMVAALAKAHSLDPAAENPLVYLGGHYINKAKRINDQRKAHAADMKTRTKPGTAASKEDIQKRDALDQQYAKTLDATIEPYEKAAALFAKKSTLTVREKQQYRFIASDLAEIYGYKKGQAKSKPAEAAKFAAEEKKWNDLYETLR
ncbi:MAG TPA: hypothetical protein VFX58_10230 [Chitinophagaceae bacterium]|nr:hypothetical protein [Chitinophagaceae bacterium]